MSEPCSLAVGTSGRDSSRCSAKTAIGRSLPAWIWGAASAIWLAPTSTWEPSNAVINSAPPSNGTSLALTFSEAKSSAWASWLPVPAPVVPNLTDRFAIRSSSDLIGDLRGTLRT